MSEKSFAVVGISDSANPEFPSEVRKIIAGSRIFSGGRRHHEIVRHLLPTDHLWIDIEAPLKKVWDNYGPHREILIFASGDPLFYGFATTLQREFSNSSIAVYPAFNSLQILSHRMLIPYAGMVNVSVTGR
ncbi:MAG: cobalamin biosynthesis bifunctional protein CbiET, partial [Muribaculaceae bacterium]|nr:cobalamin biosynthesis bifunctional protein CbiET [Muribaculaceae bacterium]